MSLLIVAVALVCSLANAEGAGDAAQKRAFQTNNAACKIKADKNACAKVARAWLLGEGVEVNFAFASELATDACANNVGEGCYVLGRVALSKEKWAEVAKLFEKSCDLSFAEGCVDLGLWVYRNGNGGAPKDPNREVALYKRGCELKLAGACLEAGDMYNSVRGSGSLPADDTAAAGYYRQGCELNEAQCCFQLARAHKFGEGVEKDSKLKAQFAAKACKLGEKNACGKW
ncbi:MAG: sel1 repeat family protein [Myxococcaceae bacterium]|nr:sel1 repeat family protein [Myxococcaceae bacterium]